MVIGDLNIDSYKSNGLADNRKIIAVVWTWLKENNYHIYCLQETPSISSDEGA